MPSSTSSCQWSQLTASGSGVGKPGLSSASGIGDNLSELRLRLPVERWFRSFKLKLADVQRYGEVGSCHGARQARTRRSPPGQPGPLAVPGPPVPVSVLSELTAPGPTSAAPGHWHSTVPGIVGDVPRAIDPGNFRRKPSRAGQRPWDSVCMHVPHGVPSIVATVGLEMKSL
jgi:hypothetical protein